MPTVKELRTRANIKGQQIPGTPFFALSLVKPDGTAHDIGTMTVSGRQMLALFRNPSEHEHILATSERMPGNG